MKDKDFSPVWVVIPAAGIGQRMGSERPKQYLKIHHKTILEHTLDCFIHHDGIAGIVIALNPDDKYWQTLNVNSETQIKPLFVVDGGYDRSDSVMQGLMHLKEQQGLNQDVWVMVHDAARPCLSSDDIDSLLSIRDTDCVGGILASPVRDTMKRAVLKENNKMTAELVSHTESRDDLWHALTPQMFRLGDLIKALDSCYKKGESITDECSAMEKMRANPVLVEGSHNNIKVTYPSDIEIASSIIQQLQRVN